MPNSVLLKDSVDWIFFDVGGVLLDGTKCEQKRIDELHHTIHIFDSRITRQQVADAIPKVSAMTGMINDNLLALFINDSQKLYMARNLIAGKRQQMNDECAEVRNNAKEVLSRLAVRYKIGLIANQAKAALKSLEQAGLDKYLAHFKISSDHGLAKPDVRYFRAVLNENNTIAEKSLIVDDNIERGLIPARHIGMKTIWFKNVERDIPENAFDYAITDLSDLIHILL